MKKVLISIIIPIYNAEKTLKRCIESIIEQTYKYIEILLIDDGSTDNSLKLCEEYQKKYNIINFYHKDNSGVSDTRNYGLKKANGEYVMFVDSDDYIDLDYIEKLYNIVDEFDADMIISNHVIENNDKKVFDVILDNKKEFEEITYPKLLDKYFTTYSFSTACKTLYSKRLIDNYNIKFNLDMNYGEDMLFSIECYIKSSKTYYSNCFGYHYIINNDSASHNQSIEKRKKYFTDNLKLYDNIKDMLSNYTYNKQYYLDALLRNYIAGIQAMSDRLKVEDVIVLKNIKKNYDEYLSEFHFFKSSLNLSIKMQIVLSKWNIGVYFRLLILKKRIKKTSV